MVLFSLFYLFYLCFNESMDQMLYLEHAWHAWISSVIRKKKKLVKSNFTSIMEPSFVCTHY